MSDKFIYRKKLKPKWMILFSIFVAVFSFGGNAGSLAIPLNSSTQTEWVNNIKPVGVKKSLKIHQNIGPYFYKNHLNCDNSFSFNIVKEFNNSLNVQYDVITEVLNSFSVNSSQIPLKVIPIFPKENDNASFLG